VDLGSAAPWNPVNFHSEGIVYSNIFLVLAALHTVMMAIYYYRLIGGARRDKVRYDV